MKLDGEGTKCSILWRLTRDCRAENGHGRQWTQRKRKKIPTSSSRFTTHTNPRAPAQPSDQASPVYSPTEPLISLTTNTGLQKKKNQSRILLLEENNVWQNCCQSIRHSSLDVQSPSDHGQTVTLRTAFPLYHLLPIHLFVLSRDPH